MRSMSKPHGKGCQREDWITPPEILAALGEFDLDPCACDELFLPTVAHHFTREDDGLVKPWFGRVWLNPPYGKSTDKWLNKLAVHGNGIALIFARTDTEMFRKCVWRYASAVLFIRGRLHFHHPDGTPAKHNAGAPSCLVAYGSDNEIVLRVCGIDGVVVSGWVRPVGAQRIRRAKS